jgi:hypothetical protein
LLSHPLLCHRSGPVGSRGCLLATLITCLVATAAASAEPRSVRLQWRPSANAQTCATESQMRKEIVTRLGRDPFTDGRAPGLDVVVDRSGSTWRANVTRLDEQGAPVGSRELTYDGPDCRGLEQALILAMALAIDPDEALDGESRSGGGGHAAPPMVPTPESFVSSTCPWCGTAQCLPKPTWFGDLGVRTLGSVGLLPTPSIGAQLSFDLRVIGPWHLELAARRWVEPREDERGSARSLGSYGAAVCLDLWRPASPKLLVCAGGELGKVASTRRSDPASTPDARWAAVRMSPTLRFKSPHAPITFEAGAELLVPVDPQPISLADGSTEAVGGRVGGILFLGVGVAIP